VRYLLFLADIEVFEGVVLSDEDAFFSDE